MTDREMIEKSLRMVEMVQQYGFKEAHIKSLDEDVDFFVEIGLMRSGAVETLSNGKEYDTRIGALPTMWERLALSQKQ